MIDYLMTAIDKMKRFKYILLFSAISSFLSFQILSNIQGKIVGVSDGDTVTLLTTNNIEIKIRLEGIDCPEKNQAYGQKAKQFTSDLCFGKKVTLQKTKQDRFGRTLGYVILPDGRNLNKEILKAGYGWHFKKYNNNPELAALEQQAKSAKIGLWVDPNPIPPWAFRKMRKNGKL